MCFCIDTSKRQMNVSQALPDSPIQMEDPLSYIDQLQQHILPEVVSQEGELNWGRLICIWREKQENGSLLIHTYAACIDGKDGSLYLDCRPRKILAKCLAHLLVRPLHTIIKTIYHLSLYPILHEIAKSYLSDKTKQEKMNVFKVVADIVRTPLYGLVLTITTLAVLIAGAFAPENLYDGRRLLGKIEQSSNWGQRHTFWTLAKCFQAYPLETLEHYGEKDFSCDTFYQGQDLIERQLANFARAQIRYKKKVFDIFDCTKLKSEAEYIYPK